MIKARSEAEFSRLLGEHGPIRADEVPHLIRTADGSWHARYRYNAVKLLGLARGPGANEALIRIAAETTDVVMWALAATTLLRFPAGCTAVMARPAMARAAARSKDPLVCAAGLQAGTMMGDEQVLREAENQLVHNDPKVRRAAVEAAAGIPALESKLRDMLLVENDSMIRPALARALAASRNPASQAVLARCFETAGTYQFGDYLTAMIHSDAPWTVTFLVDYVRRISAPKQSNVLRSLVGLSPPRPEVVALCAELLTARLDAPRDPLDFVLFECERCASLLVGTPVREREALAALLNRPDQEH